MTGTDWKKLIQIDKTWVSKQLHAHFIDVKGKLCIKLYSVKASGTTISPDGLANELHLILPHYVYSKKQIEELNPLVAGLKASHFYGKKDPQTDGKYGELLLFALVESVLECKMVAHKLNTLGNFRDQVKGGDGIFMGNYTIPDGRILPAYLIGESKIVGAYSTALKSSLDSINNFHSAYNSAQYRTTELLVAKANLLVDDSVDLDELYDRLTPTTERFKEQVLVHPILLMYDDTSIKSCEGNDHPTREDLELAVKGALDAQKATIIKSINKKLEDYPDVTKVYLDFFLIPFNDVDTFRDMMYYLIHGIPYSR